jgi:diketogulonate reductase-like aldo/keto reductase
LEALKEGKSVLSGPFTADTLHGSMWGLNYRYTTVNDCLKKDRQRMIDYSICRVKSLLDLSDIGCRPRPLPSFSVGLGTYGWKYDYRIIEMAADLGVSLIDTAEGYGYGRVETELGKTICKLENPVVVSTKIRRDHMSQLAFRSAVDRSIGKLGISPHLQIHFPNESYSNETLGKILVDLRRSGKISSFGLGNCSVDMIESMQRFLSDYSGDVIQSVQVSYSLLDRRIESCLLPYCQARGIIVIAYSPLGQDFKKMNKPVLTEIAKRHDATTSQVALAWILRMPGVVPIPRTNDLDHLRINMEAAKLILSQEDIDELDEHYPMPQE